MILNIINMTTGGTGTSSLNPLNFIEIIADITFSIRIVADLGLLHFQFTIEAETGNHS